MHPQVAACVCLFSLDKHAAIPVDTHVWQLACRYYTPQLKGAPSLAPAFGLSVGHTMRQSSRPEPPTCSLIAGCTDCMTLIPSISAALSLLCAGKTLTKPLMAAVETALQQRFGSHAGWAHNTLFISELASQRHHLPAHLQPQGHGRPRAARSASAPAALLSEAAAGEGALQAPSCAAADEAAVGGTDGTAAAAETGGSAAVPAGRHSRRVVRPKLEDGAATEVARPPVLKRRKKSAPAGAALPTVAETAQPAGLLKGDALESPAWDGVLGLHTPVASPAAPVAAEEGAAAVLQTPSVGALQCSAIHADPLKQALVSAGSSRHGIMREWRRRKALPAAAHAARLD